MKATRNTKDNIDLTGMSEREAFVILSILGLASGGINTYDVWDELQKLFPKYYNNAEWFKHPMVVEKISGSNVNLSSANFEKMFKACEFEALPVLPVKTNSLQRRDANGKFAKKVWVAYFYYPDSKNSTYWNPKYVYRTVITKIGGKKSPVLNGHTIEGVDLARGAFRKFSLNKIKDNNIVWKKEYAEDLIF